MTNETIIDEIRNHPERKQKMMQMLYEQNLPLFWQYGKSYLCTLERDDLEQDFFIGLCDAVDTFDPGRGMFTTHFPFYIRNACRKDLIASGKARKDSSGHIEAVYVAELDRPLSDDDAPTLADTLTGDSDTEEEATAGTFVDEIHA